MSWNISDKFLNTDCRVRLLEYLARSDKRQQRDVMLTILLTGLRVSEAVALRVGHLDLTARRLLVERGKGGYSGTVLLTEDAVAHLAELVRGRRPDEPVLTSSRGGAYTVRGVQKLVEKVFKDLRMPFSTHSLRHTYGTMLMEGGETLVMVKNNLRHRSIATTDAYLHCTGKLKLRRLL